MNADLSRIDAHAEPDRFVNAAVLSPDAPDMPCNGSALVALERERNRLEGFRTAFNTREHQRLLKVERAIKNVRARRKANRI